MTSVAARIRGLYEALTEACQSLPCLDPAWVTDPEVFFGEALKCVHAFALSVGPGLGLSHVDQVKLASMLHKVEKVACDGLGGGAVNQAFPSPHSLAGGLRREQVRVLASRGWMEVPITVDCGTYTFDYRDLLDVAVRSALRARRLELDGGRLPQFCAGEMRRSGTLHGDLFVEEDGTVRLMHAKDARVLMVTLHADEALVSWSGAHYMFPIRAEFASLHGGGHCVMAMCPTFTRPWSTATT